MDIAGGTSNCTLTSNVSSGNQGQHCSTCRTGLGITAGGDFVISINTEQSSSESQDHKGTKEGSQQGQAA